MGRAGAVQLERGGIGGALEAVLAGRNDVPGVPCAVVVVLVGVGIGRVGERARGAGQTCERADRCDERRDTTPP